MKKLLTLLLLTFFATTFYAPQVMAATLVKVPRGTRVLVQIDKQYTGKKLKMGDEIKAELVNDVVVNGKTVLAAGQEVYLLVDDAEPAHCWGRGGKIAISKAYTYGENERYMFDIRDEINGKDKAWVIPVSCVALILWPLLLCGFVKGKQAVIPANKIYEIRFDNAYTMPAL